MKTFQLTVFCLLSCGLFSVGINAKYITKRDSEQKSTCSRSQPCGWQIYQPYQRTIVMFMPSPCVCSSDKRCVKTDDDISISAYVYRCVPQGVDATEWNYESLEQ